jgi:hypothetical protein
VGDTAYGAVRLLEWMVDRDVTQRVPVRAKSARLDCTFSRTDFIFAQSQHLYLWFGTAQHGKCRSSHIVYCGASTARAVH